MIIIRFKGGLGNQLFQYACGRSLLINQSEIESVRNLLLDITWYGIPISHDTPRKFLLNKFNTIGSIASLKEIIRIKYPYGYISRISRFIKIRIFRKGNPSFTDKFLNKKGDIYLDGFFQTEKYFADQAQTIRKELTLKNPLSRPALKIQNDIMNSNNSVSLHIRRGDYVENAKTNQYHGTCSLGYYSKALEYITNKIGRDINIFVFSDDIDWVKNNLKFDFPTTYVSSKEIPDYEELILMSKCKHNIIANSSFSWWGAWLNNNSGKIVIAPKRWANKDEDSFKDIIPSSWIKI